MKKALVLGASGSMGYAIVNELCGRGIHVVAFARNKERLGALFSGNKHVEVVAGDVFVKEDIMNAAKDVDIIFHVVNIPYSDWEKQQEKLLINILEVSKHYGIKLGIVDNIYAYGRQGEGLVKEEAKKRPHTKKGKIRLQLEEMAKQANVRMFIAHFPDFYGPNAESTLVHHTLKGILANKMSSFVGDKKIAREYIFTPDGAKAMVELALHDEAYGQNWNIPGYGVITGEEMIQHIRELTGYTKRVITVKRGMIQFIGLFDKQMKEFMEMLYLTEKPVVLSGEKYERYIGDIPKTSYYNGLKEMIISMQKKGL
ncbi:NAD(P)H-binding protein [Bacillus thuringiensis]|uniref:NAD-dependent epimerase/dehydratase domain-containing protein n=4 Tax=Bacillus cereus group TaxID=86661 RepID=A0A9W5QNU5_BACCE|nr:MULTISPECIES: NAD-dependent epimerase/dehydratase family protein [Bacillus]EAO55772.1 NADPH-dependent glutamate synthase beta chain and related oxidoreductases [Bacillus thuringiensis serovar israelensis ATCC 35646]MED1152061.1 NAD(P)H-binding protein [Bacillus paranthracis]AFQ29293.1 NAD-dependent epimerase/dehydratase [Bacillus thuringiensis HD-789]AJH06914.1 3-beta hydroxysteroid dehydrogenase/isomerase family protein [Bacillus thuringiensis HD1002]AND27283.1 NADH-ubiquinone oxidoreducta